MNRKVGAPKGGRVHWILWSLTADFKGKYEVYYDYDKHNYVFARHAGRRLYDMFVVIQTSTHYWRFMYANVQYHTFEHFGHKSPEVIAEKMMEIYEKNR